MYTWHTTDWKSKSDDGFGLNRPIPSSVLEVQCDVGVECFVCLDELERDGKIAEELRVVEEEGWKNRLELIRMEVDVLHVGEEGEVCFGANVSR